MNALYDNFRYHFHWNENYDENYYLRLFFYVNSLILLTISWRKHERQELKPLIFQHIRKFNKIRKKAKNSLFGYLKSIGICNVLEVNRMQIFIM